MRITHIFAAAALAFAPQALGQINWQIRDAGIAGDLNQVIYSSGAFYAAGAGVWKSLDGSVWTMVSSFNSPGFKIATVGGGVLFIYQDRYWPPSKSPVDLGAYSQGGSVNIAYMNGIALVSGLLLASGSPNVGRWLDSTSKIEIITKVPWLSSSSWVIAAESEFLLGVDGVIYASPDGLDWTLRNRSGVTKPTPWKGVLYASNKLSKDSGRTWENRSAYHLPTAFGDGYLVTKLNAGMVTTSTDAITWTPRETGNIKEINDVAFGGRTFVAVGAKGGVITSSSAANPPPPVIAPQLTITPAVMIKWPSTAGLYYQPEASADLKAWNPFGTAIPGTGAEITRSFEVTGTRRYFRLVVR